MKSNAAVGYKSKPIAADGKPAASGPAPPLETKKEKTEEENFKEMEEEVHRLLEASADAKVAKKFNEALTKAKEAAAKEKKIRQLREQNNSLD
jgi:intraflagellar transport protein 88